MARIPRSYTVTKKGGFFHVVNRVNGSPRYFPFRNPQAGRKFIALLQHFLTLYFCPCASFEIMGNHYLCGAPHK